MILTVTRTALLSLVLLAGCVSTVDPDKAELDPGRAYALVSVSHSGYGWLEEMQAVYRKRGDTGEYPVPVNFRYLYQKPENGVLLRNSDKRMLGELKLLELAPGDYEFFGWNAKVARGNQGLTIVNTHWKPHEAPPPLRFSVAAGRVTYIGNVDVSFLGTKRYRWAALDERERDLAAYRSRFSAAARLPLEVQLMQAGEAPGAAYEGSWGELLFK
jgi:hypothetical protein